jgi:hypothetical protein
MILLKKTFFQNIKIKLNSNTWMNLKSLVVIFQALKPLQPQWLQRSRQSHFIKEFTDPDVLVIPKHQNDQYQSLFVEWIIKNPNFH